MADNFIYRSFLARLACIVIFNVLPLSLYHAYSYPDYSFQNIHEGLSNKYVRCILKDSRGYMWFGTFNGLNRYDGTNMMVYEHDPADSTSICHNVINDLYEDESQNIWIATAEGLNLYDYNYDQFININDDWENINHLSNTCVTSLYVDKNGIVWIGTVGGGVNSYNPKQKEFKYYLPEHLGNEGSNYINCLLKKDEGHFWIGTRSGLFLFNLEKNEVMKPLLSGSPAIPGGDYISCFASDRSGNLWFSNGKGELFILKQSENKYVVQKQLLEPKTHIADRILTLKFDPAGRLFIGKEHGGIIIFTPGTGETIHLKNDESNPNSLASNSIWSVFFDAAGKIWIGTYNQGVCLYDKYFNKFESYRRNLIARNSLAANDVKSFSCNGKDQVWIGTDGGGISIFDIHEKKIIKTLNTEAKPGLSSDAVMCVMHDSNKDVWVGYWSKGIDKIDKDLGKIRRYSVQSGGAGDNNIYFIYEDSRKNIWAGTAGSGLFRYNAAKDAFEQLDESYGIGGQSVAFVTSVLEDRQGTLWIGTLFGLFALQPAGQESYISRAYYKSKNSGSISSNRIITIFEDRSSNLWFGTIDNGINLFDRSTQTFTAYRKSEGLPGNTVNAVLEDNNGFLWIATNRGLSRFDPEKTAFTNYNRFDGLTTDDFYQNSAIGINNLFFFGGNNGFNVFCPDSISANPVKPLMTINRFIIHNNQSDSRANSARHRYIGSLQEIILDHRQSSFTIGYAGISYTQPSKNQYTYKLEGFDTDWKNAGNRTVVTYTNLEPGKYRFLVRGSNNDNVWSEIPAELSIIIRPPVWLTWWAISAYSIILVLMLYSFYRFRIERLKMKNSLIMERIAREKDNDLAQSKLQFFTNVSHEFRTPLSLIMNPLESVLHSKELSATLRSKVQLIHSNANQLLKLVNELLDFRKIDNRKMKLQVQQSDILSLVMEIAGNFSDVAIRKKIRYVTEHTNDSFQGWIDKTKFEKILNNILSNAFKYTPERGEIRITLNKIYGHQNMISVKVTDNGRGILPKDLPYIFDRFYQARSSAEQGTGIGLSIVRSLAEIHHGSVTARSVPGKYTEFHVKLPFEKNDFQADEILDNVSDIVEAEQSDHYAPVNIMSEQDIRENTGDPEILIVEDNDDLRKYLKDELKDQFRVTEARNGSEGLEMARLKIHDLILSDVMMPGMDGFQLCRNIKNDKLTSHIPVILLTARSSVNDQVHGIEDGADVYITKPFSMEFLKAQISQIIDNRKKLYALFSKDVNIIPAKFAKNKLDQDFLQDTIDFILKNITNSQMGVEMLADYFSISRGQLYKKIKALTGKTAVDFIREIRLKEAIKLMETRKYTLSEIAFETGFTSPSYFTRSFKSHYGKAPSEFMNQ